MFSGIQKKTRIILSTSFVVCLVAMGTYGGAVFLFFKKTNEVAAIPLTAQDLSRKAEEAQAAKHFLSATASSRTALREFFFREDDIVRFLGDMEQVAQRAGVSLTLTSADAKIEGGLEIEADITGSWEDLAQFLTLLDAYPAPMTITRVSLNTRSESEQGASKKIWGGTVMFTLKSYIGP